MKKQLLIYAIILGLVWQVAHSIGYRLGVEETSDALIYSCEIAIQHTQDREKQIARWTSTGCRDTADCGEMERARLADYQYTPMDGQWADWEE